MMSSVLSTNDKYKIAKIVIVGGIVLVGSYYVINSLFATKELETEDTTLYNEKYEWMKELIVLKWLLQQFGGKDVRHAFLSGTIVEDGDVGGLTSLDLLQQFVNPTDCEMSRSAVIADNRIYDLQLLIEGADQEWNIAPGSDGKYLTFNEWNTWLKKISDSPY